MSLFGWLSIPWSGGEIVIAQVKARKLEGTLKPVYTCRESSLKRFKEPFGSIRTSMNFRFWTCHRDVLYFFRCFKFASSSGSRLLFLCGRIARSSTEKNRTPRLMFMKIPIAWSMSPSYEVQVPMWKWTWLKAVSRIFGSAGKFDLQSLQSAFFFSGPGPPGATDRYR